MDGHSVLGLLGRHFTSFTSTYFLLLPFTFSPSSCEGIFLVLFLFNAKVPPPLSLCGWCCQVKHQLQGKEETRNEISKRSNHHPWWGGRWVAGGPTLVPTTNRRTNHRLVVWNGKRHTQVSSPLPVSSSPSLHPTHIAILLPVGGWVVGWLFGRSVGRPVTGYIIPSFSSGDRLSLSLPMDRRRD